MPKKESGLKDLLAEQLQDLLSAENQLVVALPKMTDAANETGYGRKQIKNGAV